MLCHYPGCKEAVPKDNCMCKPHWQRLPMPSRAHLWNLFRDRGRSERNATRFKQALEFCVKMIQSQTKPDPIKES